MAVIVRNSPPPKGSIVANSGGVNWKNQGQARIRMMVQFLDIITLSNRVLPSYTPRAHMYT